MHDWQATEEEREIRQGEADQRAIFNEYHHRVFRFFKSRKFSDDEARDLTQDTFVRVFQNMENLRSRAALESWILKIAAGIWKNELRYRKAAKRDAPTISMDEPDTGGAIESAASEERDIPSSLDEVLSSEHLALVETCLAALPPRMRRCLILHTYQERKYQEIADLLQVSIQSVKSHIHQARQHLKDCVAKRFAGEGP